METALITLIIIPLLANGQNGYGDYQDQPPLVYQQFPDQDYNLQQYPDYPIPNEQFNQYGPVDPGIFNNEAIPGGGPAYMPNYYNEPVQENLPDSDWYVPQGAIPQGFELEENLGKEGNLQPPVNVQPQPGFQPQPVNVQPQPVFQPQPGNVQPQPPVFQPQPPALINGPEENQPVLYDWADYSQNGFSDYQEQDQPIYQPSPEQEFTPLEYPIENEMYDSYLPGPVPIAGNEPIDGYENTFYDYNNFYGGPCMEPPLVWDDECGGSSGGQEVPYCDEATCSRSCKKYMNLDKGRCLENECFCENNNVVQPTKPTPKPKPIPNPDDDWDYIRQDEWPSKFPNCGLSQQSPISLTSKELRDLTKKINLRNYEKPIGLIVENTGHGVRIYVQAKEVPSLILSGVTQKDDSTMTKSWDGTFSLAYIDLHWATSEHSVEGEIPADLEMQLHHFDLSFDSYENAVEVPGATISLSLLFKISPNATDLCKSIIKAVKDLPIGGSGEKLMKMAHLKFIVEKMTKTTSYYSYAGRQTQPPCNRINWMIPKMTFDVTRDQIEELQKLKDVFGNDMLNNVRNVQNSS